jgi:hypothetical protein
VTDHPSFHRPTGSGFPLSSDVEYFAMTITALVGSTYVIQPKGTC